MYVAVLLNRRECALHCDLLAWKTQLLMTYFQLVDSLLFRKFMLGLKVLKLETFLGWDLWVFERLPLTVPFLWKPHVWRGSWVSVGEVVKRCFLTNLEQSSVTSVSHLWDWVLIPHVHTVMSDDTIKKNVESLPSSRKPCQFNGKKEENTVWIVLWVD